MKKRIKIQGFLIFLSVMAVVFFYKQILQEGQSSLSNLIFSGIGLLLVISGYFLRIIARGHKADENPDGKTLVTTGVYKLMRNPMYFGTLLIGLGVILFLFKWWIAVIFLVVYLSIYIPEITKEEAKLKNLFGEAFKNYCKHTPKFFPSLSVLFKRGGNRIFSVKPKWLKKEFSSLAWILAFLIIAKIIFNSILV
ncbi:MAG: isoprenylcysteine carboxylmethyltransferase family protein [Candidatus Omnitrophica bacterium]|nr:isoprenylcysteine carboxylmethyltransferase family protein [Candidatus Omnitrophota bacterium]